MNIISENSQNRIVRNLAIAVIALASEAAYACTNFIVGKKASADGSVMCTYNADDYGMFIGLCHLSLIHI